MSTSLTISEENAMSEFAGLLDQIPVSDIATRFGISEDAARNAVAQAVPAILGGMAANAQDAGGARSLERALQSHAEGGQVQHESLDTIDLADGDRIVDNVFGAQRHGVAAAVADRAPANVTQDLIAKILPIVAPIVISYLASRFLGGRDAPTASPAPAQSSGGIGDILGGLLGGGSGAGGDVLGGVLGGLLGGGRR